MKYIIGMDIGSVLIMIVMMIVYYSKKKVKSFDTTFYSILLITTFIGYIVEAVMFFSVMKEYDFSGTLISIYLSYLILEGLLFVLYNCIKLLSYKYDKDWNIIKKKLTIVVFPISILLVAAVILTFLLPGDVVYQGEWAYGTGIGVTFIVIALAISAGLIIYNNIKYRKKLNSKDKMFYISSFVLYIILAAFRQFTPYIAVTNIFLSTITLIMFFTIENPDTEVINEMNKLNNVKSNFLSSMSHELKTPLNAIVGLSSAPSDDLETMKSDMETINQESLLLLDMFTNVININLVDAKDIKMNKYEYKVRDEFQNIINSFDKRYKAKGLVLNFNVADNIPDTLYGDFEKIRDITCNFLSNSLKFTEHGAADLNLSYEERVGVPYLKIEVRDTGKGISDEDFKVIFREFGKGKDDINSDVSGLGIGLSLCKILADSLDGKISLGSVEGIGSAFVVEIPQEIKKAL